MSAENIFTFTPENTTITTAIVPPVGINPGWKLTSAKLAKLKEDDDRPKVLIFEYTHVTGALVRDVVFNPADSDKDWAAKQFQQKLFHVLSTFVGEKDALIKASDYRDFAEQVVDLLDGKTDDELVMKVVYGKNGFTQLPLFGKFIEKAVYENGALNTPVVLAIDPRYDLLVRPVPNETVAPAIADGIPAATNGGSASDLPF